MSKLKAKTNPYGANQHKPDPRQALFISYYFDQKSDTFANGLQSAIKAGFEEEYAKVLVSIMPTWLSEKVNDSYIVQKAEGNLKEFLEMETVSTKEVDGMISKTDDPQLKRIKSDMTKFALERLNKKKYSARTEMTGEDGGAIKITPLLGGDSNAANNSHREIAQAKQED